MNSNHLLQVENLDHLGLVAGIIDEIGIVEQINQLLGQHETERVSAGQVVKAMILNGLGFVSAPLYMFSKFYEGKATEHLIGEGVKPEHLNDDRLGRVLDKLYLAGLSQVFMVIALAAVKKFEVKTHRSHLDSTSLHLHGQYENSLPAVSFITRKINPNNPKSEEVEETIVPQAIQITYGYSRDFRPDLKQFILDLICSGDGDVPLFLRVADGNEQDKAVFARILCEFSQQLDLESLMIADSALYTAANLALMKNLKWLCRVPLTVAQAKQLISQLREEDFVKSTLDGYQIAQHLSNYGGVAQRWIVVESETRKQADLRQLERRLVKAEQTAHKKLQQLYKAKFACAEDAIKAASELSQQLKYHCLSDIITVEADLDKTKKSKRGQPSENSFYQIQASLVRDTRAIESEIRCAGRFVLATNVLDISCLSNDEMLAEYKAQQGTERGFGFLKDPLFFTDSVFLKSPERVSALALVMGLCLLVYTLGQRQLRLALEQSQLGIKNQLGKLTRRPTLRWVFQCFQAVHLITIAHTKQITNLTPERLNILRFFPSSCRQYYLLS
ncbi:MAG: IS1634 family transposase [Cyanobacteriota bacterium]